MRTKRQVNPLHVRSLLLNRCDACLPGNGTRRPSYRDFKYLSSLKLFQLLLIILEEKHIIVKLNENILLTGIVLFNSLSTIRT